jgi:dihydroxy-acid dehydratase
MQDELVSRHDDEREHMPEHGLVGMRFSAAGVNDALAMGTAGMRYSLPSRDLIADSVEMVMQAYAYDGLVAIPGCDKNLPGCLLAIARLDRPALLIYGGHIAPGRLNDETIDIVSAFQAYGECVAHRITPERYDAVLRPTRARARAPAAACTRPRRWR